MAPANLTFIFASKSLMNLSLNNDIFIKTLHKRMFVLFFCVHLLKRWSCFQKFSLTFIKDFEAKMKAKLAGAITVSDPGPCCHPRPWTPSLPRTPDPIAVPGPRPCYCPRPHRYPGTLSPPQTQDPFPAPGPVFKPKMEAEIEAKDFKVGCAVKLTEILKQKLRPNWQVIVEVATLMVVSQNCQRFLSKN